MDKGHDAALRLIDQQLLPASREAAVQQQLRETRGHVAQHLERAEALLSQQRTALR